MSYINHHIPLSKEGHGQFLACVPTYLWYEEGVPVKQPDLTRCQTLYQRSPNSGSNVDFAWPSPRNRKKVDEHHGEKGNTGIKSRNIFKTVVY